MRVAVDDFRKDPSRYLTILLKEEVCILRRDDTLMKILESLKRGDCGDVDAIFLVSVNERNDVYRA